MREPISSMHISDWSSVHSQSYQRRQSEPRWGHPATVHDVFFPGVGPIGPNTAVAWCEQYRPISIFET